MNVPPTIPLVPDHPAPLTKQAVFDAAWKWSQAHPSCLNNISSCCYRSDDKQNACLIGAIIPDSRYEESLEGYAVDVLYNRLSNLFDRVDSVWLLDLQGCHDQVAGLASRGYTTAVTRNLIAFATKHNLSIPSTP